MDENLDMVKTYRIKRSDGWYRRTLSSAHNIIFTILFPKLPCHDVNSKPKIFKADVLQKMDLLSDDWFIDAEIMIQASRFKARIGEVDTVFHSISSRASFVKPLAILEFLGNLIYYRIKEFKE